MLPRDIMVDIFSRLPAKTVGISRCVSKVWKSLLNEPYFIKLHLNRTKLASTDEVSLLLCDQDDAKLLNYCKPKYSIKLKLVDDQVNAHVAAKKLNFGIDLPVFSSVISSCDGLVLFEHVKNEDLWLMNPTTMKITKLPPSCIPLPNFVFLNMQYGIGYDQSSDDYKVVSLVRGDNNKVKEVFVNIYSVKYGTWKRVRECGIDLPCSLFGYIHRGGFCVNGRIHWIAQDASRTSFVVATFDLETERFHQIPTHALFNPIDQNFVTPLLGILEGCLCLYYFRARNNRGIDVWIMKEYGVPESWTKINIKARDDELILIYLCLLTKQQLVMLRGCAYYKSKEVVMYNMKESGFKNIALDGIPSNYTITQSHVFVESLVSPYPWNIGSGITKAFERSIYRKQGMMVVAQQRPKGEQLVEPLN